MDIAGDQLGATRNEGMCGARDLGGDGRHCFASEMGVGPVAGDVSLEPVAETVVPLPDGDLRGHPEDRSQQRRLFGTRAPT